MLTVDLRAAIARAAAAAGLDAAADPKLRPAGAPGRYATSLPLSLAGVSTSFRDLTVPVPAANAIAAGLAEESWIADAAVTGGGYVTITVTPAALAAVAARVIAAGPNCARSDVLRGIEVAGAPAADLAGAASWAQARAALAAELTARLARAAGATISPPAGAARASSMGARPVAAAAAFAGGDAVRLALARVIPGKPAGVDPAQAARYSLGNPAYAVRYAHARAVSGVRWAAALGATTPAAPDPAAGTPLPTDPVDWALLDALSWLPERAATAARRGRPDEFARYLEELARATIAAVRFTRPQDSRPQDSRTLAVARDLAAAARTGLAAGLGLLGVVPPECL